jgi:multimeric flavodoxin WrbA
MLIPAKLRAFMERLGCTFYSFYEVPSVRHMKTIGVVTNGTHLYGGQELALVNLILDAVSMKCIAVAGDNPESYIGASAWTYGDWKGTALTQRSKDKDSLDPTFSISIKAARSVVQRCVEVASILKTGGIALKESLNQDPRYRPWVRKISESQ